MDDEDRWQLEAARREPAMALRLRRIAARLGATGEKDDLPPPVAGEPPQPRDRTRFDLVERFPEILARARRFPQLALLPRGERRHAESGRRRRRSVCGNALRLRQRRDRSGERAWIDAWKQTASLTRQRALKIGDGAVQVEP